MRKSLIILLSVLSVSNAEAGPQSSTLTLNRDEMVSLDNYPFAEAGRDNPTRWKHIRLKEGDRLLVQDKKSGLKFFLTCGSKVRYNHVAFSVANPDVSLFQIRVGQTVKYNYAENYKAICAPARESDASASLASIPEGEAAVFFSNGRMTSARRQLSQPAAKSAPEATASQSSAGV